MQPSKPCPNPGSELVLFWMHFPSSGYLGWILLQALPGDPKQGQKMSLGMELPCPQRPKNEDDQVVLPIRKLSVSGDQPQSENGEWRGPSRTRWST